MVDHYQHIFRQVVRLLESAPANGRWQMADQAELEAFAHAFARICETARDIEALLATLDPQTTADEADDKLYELETYATMIGTSIVNVRDWADRISELEP